MKEKIVEREIRFIDSFKFMASSLDKLTANLDEASFQCVNRFFHGQVVDLVRRKGIYPYDYVDSITKLSETKLPPQEQFYSELNHSSISDENYEHARNVWKYFDMKTIRDYHDLYLKTDVLLLADIFENFRDVCIENYKLDPAWYYTSPALAWDACLKKTEVNLELLNNVDMLLMIEKGIHAKYYLRKFKSKHKQKNLHRITLNQSSANPGETLYLYIPKLSENKVIVPRSVSLRFDLILEGHANNTVVNNVARNLISQFKVKFASETLQDTTRYDLIKTYEDLFTDRDNKLKQGISSENTRKLRTNAGDKDDSNTKEVTLASIHNTKYCIPINHPILDDHGVFYPWALSHPLCFEITFAPVNNVVIYSDKTKPPNYEITNLELEYRCISSEFLANEAAGGYQVGCGFLYENIVLPKTFNISKATDAIINEHVNIPRRSMTGILCLFTEAFTAGTRDSEKFVNPKVTSVNFNIDGVPNKLFSNGMLPSDFWQSLNNRFNTKDTLK